MGLFDKLRSAIDFVENKLQDMNQNTTLPSANHAFEEELADPLADETVKKYFEILCGTGRNYRKWDEFPMAELRAKRFVEYFLNDACDEELFEKAKELFERSDSYNSSEEDSKLRKYAKAAAQSGAYCMDEREAYRKFCQEEIDAATVEYNNVLEVIKDNVNYTHFSQGLSKMNCDYTIKMIVISDSFYSGNPITQELIKQYLIDTYTARINDESNKNYHYVGDDIALLIVKALHFEKYGQDRENYKTASYEEYRNFVMIVNAYKKVIDKYPFEKELHTDRLAERITRSKVFTSTCTPLAGGYFCLPDEDEYFCDAACHFLWTEIVRKGAWVNKDGEDISETRDYNELFGIWATYFIH